MRTRLRGRYGSESLLGAWRAAKTPAGQVTDPGQLHVAPPQWIAADGPTTAAAALRRAGRFDPECSPDFDADDWWFQCRFQADPSAPAGAIRFEGLATHADVWLDGVLLGTTDNMFRSFRFPIAGLAAGEHDLSIRCRSLTVDLARKRPRPRSKTLLVSHQQLRWQRTTLLGRIPAWCPPIAPVGPWRPVLMEPVAPVTVERVRLIPRLDRGSGVVDVDLLVTAEQLTGASLRVGGVVQAFVTTAEGRFQRLRGAVTVPGARLWWPHTHGGQPRYQVEVQLEVGGEVVVVDLGSVGFRTIEIDREADGQGFGIVVNGVPVFSRGACWTPLDLVTLGGSAEAYRAALLQVRDGGLNMIRVGGTMVYEDDVFYDTCDELGIMVWHDFMFANMDYPVSDPGFLAGVEAEAGEFLERMAGRPSLAVLCGGSEVAQQAAMLGRPPEDWSNALFDSLLPALAAERTPGVPWVASSPTGGGLPFQVDQGPSHYYGVGAYLRPLEDARRAGVRFTSECLGFSNVPEPAMVERVLADGEAAPQAASWKRGVPRDRSVGWDFEDVRDHYLGQLFRVEPAAVRYRDSDRYLAFGRVATGEVMGRTLMEWRRPGSSCRGALVWFFRDLRPGAGWGLTDSAGEPKAAYWYYRRAALPVALVVTDEGLNGLRVAVVNDTAREVAGTVHLTLYRDGFGASAAAARPVRVPGRGAVTFDAAGPFGRFLDLTYSYRFGPPDHDAVTVRFEPADPQTAPATVIYRPNGLPAGRLADLSFDVTATATSGGYSLAIRATGVAHGVRIEAPGFRPDDNYFDLEPGTTRTVLLTGSGALAGFVESINSPGPVPIRLGAP